ncbi:bifunctional adenosylcobinamide kinase/adenosylcobinamide-phosphate guanylyltransferase [Mesobacillus selenatarsenatis]|uniref:bifunctional adenosylcobinamide kinase/adenosylcobinamide-phosphate guanylyltransferase n=1 Tax=Mesobacillus selenatarsenatis TaxID=388741 RepID=UPI0005A95ACD|nr:bifunctional adenosylcobinamide kinase/adenosylcobinamide-phosphate guanylyltransferase [Mesobacillus selenatarsenatis]
MHFVTGGAFNGKSKWVREQYQLNETEHSWHSAYQKDPILEPDNEKIVVFEGLEVWLRESAVSISLDETRQKWQSLIQKWLEWENQDSQRKVILIGCDISKGIVPMVSEDRRWRDITGWIYQDIMSVAERADVIWYGISQKLK